MKQVRQTRIYPDVRSSGAAVTHPRHMTVPLFPFLHGYIHTTDRQTDLYGLTHKQKNPNFPHPPSPPPLLPSSFLRPTRCCGHDNPRQLRTRSPISSEKWDRGEEEEKGGGMGKEKRKEMRKGDRSRPTGSKQTSTENKQGYTFGHFK